MDTNGEERAAWRDVGCQDIGLLPLLSRGDDFLSFPAHTMDALAHACP